MAKIHVGQKVDNKDFPANKALKSRLFKPFEGISGALAGVTGLDICSIGSKQPLNSLEAVRWQVLPMRDTLNEVLVKELHYGSVERTSLLRLLSGPKRPAPDKPARKTLIIEQKRGKAVDNESTAGQSIGISARSARRQGLRRNALRLTTMHDAGVDGATGGTGPAARPGMDRRKRTPGPCRPRCPPSPPRQLYRTVPTYIYQFQD